MKSTDSPLLKVKKTPLPPLLKSALLIGLICLAGLLMVGGISLCYTTEGNERFMIGVLVVAVGAVLFGSMWDFIKGVGEDNRDG